ncbi:hypothetical protein LCGC14_1502680 [marine sediment metagenome]|uniref:Uncharacterized protein n=1 Tax=marine sediment metagenome TaxID=412755 RepID=A0A0F9M534_9ZZZZ
MICPLHKAALLSARTDSFVTKSHVKNAECDKEQCVWYLYDTAGDQYMCSILVIASCLYEKR